MRRLHHLRGHGGIHGGVPAVLRRQGQAAGPPQFRNHDPSALRRLPGSGHRHPDPGRAHPEDQGPPEPDPGREHRQARGGHRRRLRTGQFHDRRGSAGIRPGRQGHRKSGVSIWHRHGTARSCGWSATAPSAAAANRRWNS